MSGHALLYVGGLALGLLAYALFLLVAGLAVRPLRRLKGLDHLLPPHWLGCVAAGVAWVVAASWFWQALLAFPLAGALIAPSLSPGVIAVSMPLESRGVDTLKYGTGLLVAGSALDAAVYSIICYALCRFVRPRRRLKQATSPSITQPALSRDTCSGSGGALAFPYQDLLLVRPRLVAFDPAVASAPPAIYSISDCRP